MRHTLYLALTDISGHGRHNFLSQVRVKGQLNLRKALCFLKLQCNRRTILSEFSFPIIVFITYAACNSVDHLLRPVSFGAAGSSYGRLPRLICLIVILKSGNVAVIAKQGLLQLVNMLANLSGGTAVLHCQSSCGASRLTADRAGTHNAGGAECHLGGADIAACQHHVSHILSVEASVGNRVAAVKVQDTGRQLIKVHDTAADMLIHLPAAVSNSIVENTICTHIIFI